MLRLLKFLLLGFATGIAVHAAEPPPGHPWESSSWSVETGLLWELGLSTPIAYRLVPTQISWRSREAYSWSFEDGSRLVFRHRLTLLATWFENGPESHYIAFDGSPSLEWWNRAGTTAVYGGAGGGFGWLDSQGVPGSQGQDFTFNWFMRAGIEHIVRRNLRLTGGIMYQHMSNAGQTNPNPGINALGFSIGCAWNY